MYPEYPVNVEIISMVISFLTSEKYSASTMLSNVSAVSYIHKLEGWRDPTDSFLIKKMLCGVKNKKKVLIYVFQYLFQCWKRWTE